MPINSVQLCKLWINIFRCFSSHDAFRNPWWTAMELWKSAVRYDKKPNGTGEWRSRRTISLCTDSKPNKSNKRCIRRKSSTVSSIHKSALGATENSFAGRCACAIAPSTERYHEICKWITLIHSHFFLLLFSVHCRPQLAPAYIVLHRFSFSLSQLHRTKQRLQWKFASCRTILRP